jgi:AmmeMemoRadiSam system radical SAM enzyme
MVLTTYGVSTGFQVDPIEKKPLNHFYPGSRIFSFGTAGCNLGCRFCQNWSISKAKTVERLSAPATPEEIVEAALRAGCQSVAFTYNDPIIWAEYAIDTARACKAAGVRSVAVTAGYITEQARPEFFKGLDAANIDLKAFTETFYHKLCFAHLEPVLETLKWVHDNTDVWMEVTNLIIPGENDSDDELSRLSDWLVANLGPDVPLHLTAFHPDFMLRDHPPTPPETLTRARRLALESGLHYVYTGNVYDPDGQCTYCPGCGNCVIERDRYHLGKYSLDNDKCCTCDTQIAGRFDGPPKPRPSHRPRRVRLS